jgi:glycosyltransferase involved in cell wall biosynthesis
VPTALLTLFDTWVYDTAVVDGVELIASWVPVDHLPVPPKVLAWSQRPTVMSVAMSKFGLEQLQRADVDAQYAPHSVDTSTFKPGATVDGKNGRELLNIPQDAFVVGMVAANKGSAPIRKAFGENLLAMSELMSRHQDVILYLHTESRGAAMGIDLKALVSACGIPSERVVWVDQWAYYAGLDSEVLATIMGAFDVHLLCSRGEGFGVPVLEAAACGVPSIVSDFTAQPELVEGSGWLATVQPYWDAGSAAWFCTPLIHSIVEQLEDAYQCSNMVQRSINARVHAENYAHNTVFQNHWEPILDLIDERVNHD